MVAAAVIIHLAADGTGDIDQTQCNITVELVDTKDHIHSLGLKTEYPHVVVCACVHVCGGGAVGVLGLHNILRIYRKIYNLYTCVCISHTHTHSLSKEKVARAFCKRLPSAFAVALFEQPYAMSLYLFPSIVAYIFGQAFVLMTGESNHSFNLFL